MRWILAFLILIPLSTYAKCDLSTFRWGCNMSPKLNPGKHLIQAFCNGTPVYLNKKQWQIVNRYERSYVNLVLKVNGEYMTGPCRIASQ